MPHTLPKSATSTKREVPLGYLGKNRGWSEQF